MRTALVRTTGLMMMAAVAVDARADQRDDAEGNGDAVTVELSTIGVDMRAGAPVVLLRDGESDQVVPIWVGPAEARAIYLALRDIATPRPMTHDLLADVIDQLGATVHEVVVYDLRESTYFGRIRLELGETGEVRDIDSRPSDAMALALRTGAPIRVARKVLQQVPPFDFIIPDELDPVVRTLGVTVVELSGPRRAEHEVPADTQGVLITAVEGEAREQGIRRGDVIQSVNGQAVTDPMEYFDAVRAAAGAGALRLTIWRGGETFGVELEPGVPDPPRRERRDPPVQI